MGVFDRGNTFSKGVTSKVEHNKKNLPIKRKGGLKICL